MNQRTKKLMMMHKVLHPRNRLDSIYVPGKEGERGLTSIEGSVNATIRELKEHTKIIKKGQLLRPVTAMSNARANNKTTKSRMQK